MQADDYYNMYDDYHRNTIIDYNNYNNVADATNKKRYAKDLLLKILNNNSEHVEYFLSLIG